MSFWTVAQTETRRERTAVCHLRRHGFETYLPVFKNRMKQTEPLFPDYLFVRIEDRWRVINATIGVLRVLTCCERPACVADRVIEEIRARETPAGFVKLPQLEPQVGSKVRITRGMFADHVGIYQGASGHERERVLLSMLGRMVVAKVPPKYLQLEVGATA